VSPSSTRITSTGYRAIALPPRAHVVSVGISAEDEDDIDEDAIEDGMDEIEACVAGADQPIPPR
jgi:hypothetical protein